MEFCPEAREIEGRLHFKPVKLFSTKTIWRVEDKGDFGKEKEMSSYPPSTPAPTGGRVSLPGNNRHVEDLLLWRDVQRSAIYFVAITIAYGVLEWSNFSLLKIISNTLLLTVVISFLWSNVASYTNIGGVPVPAVIRQGISEAQIRNFAERAVVPTNRVLAFAKRVISGQDVVLAVQTAGLLYIFGRLGSYFSSLGLLYLVVVLAFTVPKAYELNKKEVDNVVNSVQKQSKTYYKQYAEPYIQKIPRASTSTANTGSVTAGNHTGDAADSYARAPKSNLQAELNAAAHQQPKKFP